MNTTQVDLSFQHWQEQLNNHLEASFSGSKVSFSYYDMAWLLRLHQPENPENPLFPNFLNLLLEAQNADGSWGHHRAAPYVCDSLVSSLSVVLALLRWHARDELIPNSIQRGLFAINRLLLQVHQDSYKSVGFEMLLPSLLEEALDCGLHLVIPQELDSIIEQRKRKLALLPLDKLGQRASTLLHSLEALYKVSLDWEQLAQVQDRNGAFLSSPASSAKVYLENGNARALAYLLELNHSGTVPVNTPIDIFEVNWSLEIIYQLGLSPYLSASYHRGLEFLRQRWTSKGISWSSQFDLPDLDNSSVAFYLLSLNNQAPNAEVFENFYNEEAIYCFYGELDSSPTHLLHFLQALQQLSNQTALRERVLEKLLRLFKANHWRDKWHLSPYYTIALSIQPLSQLHPATVDSMLRYIFANESSAWGVSGASLEETAWVCYALYQALDVPEFAARYGAEIQQALAKGVAYLKANYHPETTLENLWIDKCLYSPYSIVHTLITAVLMRAAL
jgi:halimadienyl-diphosphate synthase